MATGTALSEEAKRLEDRHRRAPHLAGDRQVRGHLLLGWQLALAGDREGVVDRSRVPHSGQGHSEVVGSGCEWVVGLFGSRAGRQFYQQMQASPGFGQLSLVPGTEATGLAGVRCRFAATAGVSHRGRPWRPAPCRLRGRRLGVEAGVRGGDSWRSGRARRKNPAATQPRQQGVTLRVQKGGQVLDGNSSAIARNRSAGRAAAGSRSVWPQNRRKQPLRRPR